MDEQQYHNDNNVLTIQDLDRETDFNERYLMQCGVCVCMCVGGGVWVCVCVLRYISVFTHTKKYADGALHIISVRHLVKRTLIH